MGSKGKFSQWSNIMIDSSNLVMQNEVLVQCYGIVNLRSQGAAQCDLPLMWLQAPGSSWVAV